MNVELTRMDTRVAELRNQIAICNDTLTKAGRPMATLEIACDFPCPALTTSSASSASDSAARKLQDSTECLPKDSFTPLTFDDAVLIRSNLGSTVAPFTRRL